MVTVRKRKETVELRRSSEWVAIWLCCVAAEVEVDDVVVFWKSATTAVIMVKRRKSTIRTEQKHSARRDQSDPWVDASIPDPLLLNRKPSISLWRRMDPVILRIYKKLGGEWGERRAHH